jgi:predicted RNA-binding protein with PUA-like domain
MAYFLLKTEPTTYSYADLEKAGQATWDGVANPFAVANLRAAKKGDLALVYHTGKEKAVVGVADVVSDGRDDPKDAKLAVFDLRARKAFVKAVTLATIKGEAVFADSPLVKQGRLSVVKLTDAQWKRLLELGGVKL